MTENRSTTVSRTFGDRKRTHLMFPLEQKTILSLVPRMPPFITPDRLTAIGTLGSILVLVSFILGHYYDVRLLMLGVLGLAVNWFGDSLDGRLAYYRNIPRKWYGFSLDVMMDWFSTFLIGLGYLIYAPEEFKIVAFLFVTFYGWAMIISQLRYKITDKYTIDSGYVGPTEIRIIISLILITEVIFPGAIHYLGIGITAVLFIINLSDSLKLLKMADSRDLEEKK